MKKPFLYSLVLLMALGAGCNEHRQEEEQATAKQDSATATDSATAAQIQSPSAAFPQPPITGVQQDTATSGDTLPDK